MNLHFNSLIPHQIDHFASGIAYGQFNRSGRYAESDEGRRYLSKTTGSMNENDTTPSSSDEEIDVCLPGKKNEHALFEIHVFHPPKDKKPSRTTAPFSAPRGSRLLTVAPFDDERCHSDSDTSDDEIQRSNYYSKIQTRSSNGGRTIGTNLHDNKTNDEEQEVDYSFEPISPGYPPQMPPCNTNLLSDSFTPHQSGLLAVASAYDEHYQSDESAESEGIRSSRSTPIGSVSEYDMTPDI